MAVVSAPFILHFLIGPTASGKSGLALRWAEATGGELLYCDASCVYRGMDIGTAKPDAGERARVPHHGIDLVPVDRPFSIADYVAEARRVVDGCRARGVPLLVTGGTGFYARSFFQPVTDETEVPGAVRDRVREIASQGVPALLAELRRVNPDGLSGIDLQNPRRLSAALERCLASGLPLAELQRRYAQQPKPFEDFEKRLVVLSRPLEELDRRIAARTQAMLEQGLVEEVRRLRASGLERNPAAASAIGYREALHCLDNGGSSEALAAEINQNTRRLARRQISYFRSQLPEGKILALSGEEMLKAGEIFG